MANNMEKKMTNKVALEKAIMYAECYGENTGAVEVPEVIAKLEKMLESLEKKNTKSGKPTKTQEANIALEAVILQFMAERPNQLFTTTDIIKTCPPCAGLNTQKVAPRLNAMEKEGKVSKTKDKGKTLWQYLSGAWDTEEDAYEEDYEG